MYGIDKQAEREASVRMVRQFANEVVAPVVASLDRQPNPEDSFSWEVVEKASAVGIRTLTLAEEYGGSGADSLTAAMVIGELAKIDLGVSVIFAQTLKLTQTLQRACTKEQKDRFLTKFAKDPKFLLAIGITEPETGSDYFIPHRNSEAAFRTTATRSEEGWVVNGHKHFISNGSRASLYLVFAQTDRERNMTEGSTCFLIERGTPGFSIGQVHNKMGERLVNNAELFFDDCFVPPTNLLGKENKGFDLLSQFFHASNAYAAASILGVAEAAYGRALQWTKQRVQGGRPLIQHDMIGAELAEMRMLIDVARSYTYQATWAADHPEVGWTPTMGAYPKVFASQVAWKVVTKAMELHGGSGYMREVGMEKLVRDAAAFLHSDGVNRTLLLKAARFIRQEAGVEGEVP